MCTGDTLAGVGAKFPRSRTGTDQSTCLSVKGENRKLGEPFHKKKKSLLEFVGQIGLSSLLDSHHSDNTYYIFPLALALSAITYRHTEPS